MALRQLLIKSVLSNTNKTKASKPTDKALTCTTAYTGRAMTCRVANSSQRGVVSLGTHLRSNFKTNQVAPANIKVAIAKPPTVIKPSLTSRLAHIKAPAKPTKPVSRTPKEAGCSPPMSRRITRMAGTLANCKTGGKPNANNKVRPMPKPNSAGAPELGGN